MKPTDNPYIKDFEKRRKNAVFVLGAKNLEMDMVERLFAEAKVPYAYAAVPNEDGDLRRVLSGEGYKAIIRVNPSVGKDLLFNVGPEGWDTTALHVNHGFSSLRGLPLTEAWKASYLGRVWHLLQLWGCIKAKEPPVELVMIAECAWDAEAFVQGKCSTPKEEARQFFLKRKHEELAADLPFEYFEQLVVRTEKTLRAANKIADYDNTATLVHLVPDATPLAATGEVYPHNAQFVEVASLLTGIAYAVRVQCKDGALELRLGGFSKQHPVIKAYWAHPLRWGVYVHPTEGYNKYWDDHCTSATGRYRAAPLALGDLFEWEDLALVLGFEWEPFETIAPNDFGKLKDGQEIYVLTGEHAASEPEPVLAVMRVMPGVPFAVATFKCLADAWAWLDSRAPYMQLVQRLDSKQHALVWRGNRLRKNETPTEGQGGEDAE